MLPRANSGVRLTLLRGRGSPSPVLRHLRLQVHHAREGVGGAPMNSREKGKRGERAWRDELRANGFDARRGVQFAGGPDSPDVVCPALPGLHQEVKCVEKLNLEAACEQAARDGNGKPWIVAHRRRFKGWRVTMPSDLFFSLLRGDSPAEISRREPTPKPNTHGLALTGDGGKTSNHTPTTP